MGVTEDQKDEARARILSKVTQSGPVTGSWEEIRTALDLEDIPLNLFKRSCWHLKKGDRDPEEKPRITFTRMVYQDRTALYERPPFIITAL
jgi:hypothetical protein